MTIVNNFNVSTLTMHTKNTYTRNDCIFGLLTSGGRGGGGAQEIISIIQLLFAWHSITGKADSKLFVQMKSEREEDSASSHSIHKLHLSVNVNNQNSEAQTDQM